ncbi:MAG: alpha/beta hydrolase family protein [Terriglobales bacterium]
MRPLLVLTCALSLTATAAVAQLNPSQPKLLPGREHIPGADVFITTVQSAAGFPLRAFVTLPHGATGKLPVIFEVAWLSCDSVEQPNGPEDGFTQLLYDLASRSGYATFRVDKPGTGESGGPKCGDADFEAELAAYRSALAALKDFPQFDLSRIYVLGFSNGGGFAPLVAGDTPVRGYIVASGWYKTWLEHMLEHERRRMKLSGLAEAEINARMKPYANFYDLYLNGDQTPGEIVAAHPEMKAIWYDEPARQYGRPAAYYQQLQALNLAGAWQHVAAPVLAIHGEYDWVMSADDYRLMAAALNAGHPGQAEFVDWPRLDHGLYAHQSAQLAFGHDAKQSYDPKLTEYVLAWLKKH